MKCTKTEQYGLIGNRPGSQLPCGHSENTQQADLYALKQELCADVNKICRGERRED
jgi:hypothetical protein